MTSPSILRNVPRRALAALAALALAASGCGDAAPDTTTGRRVALEVRVVGAPKTFVTKQGWEVSLTKALIATGPLYFFDGETLFAGATARARPPSVDPLAWLLGERVAHAHPGHYVAGAARGELLPASSVDLLAADTPLGEGRGLSGLVRSATMSFASPPSGPLAGELGGHVIVLEGTAKKGGEARAFRAEVDAADLLDASGRLQIEGCPFKEVDLQSDGRVTLSVQIAAWFAEVELELVPPGPASKLADVPRAELVRSIKGADRYRFAFEPKPK